MVINVSIVPTQNFTQYIPLSMLELQSWLGVPSIYVYDCSNAGVLLRHLNSRGLWRVGFEAISIYVYETISIYVYDCCLDLLIAVVFGGWVFEKKNYKRLIYQVPPPSLGWDDAIHG